MYLRGGDNVFKNKSFSVRCNVKERGFYPNFDQNITKHGEKNVRIINFSSILTKTSEMCIYIVNIQGVS